MGRGRGTALGRFVSFAPMWFIAAGVLLGYLSGGVIGGASTAPGYRLAAALGGIALVAGMGGHAPAFLLPPGLTDAAAPAPAPGAVTMWPRHKAGRIRRM